MNFKIAVCDDEEAICRGVFDILAKISEDLSVKLETDCFTNGEELCEEMKNTKYDLIFLDIELPKMNGVAVGRCIRENIKRMILKSLRILRQAKTPPSYG